MVVPTHSISLIRPRHAIRPVILHVLPPAAQAIQADDQGSHGRHTGHQVDRPMLTASCGRALLLTGSLPGETLAAQALRGSRQYGLPPILVGQRVLVADTAAWWAGRLLVSILIVRRVRLCHPRLLPVIAGLVRGQRGLASSSRRFSIRSLGIVFRGPARGRPIDRTLMGDPISITPGRKTGGDGG